MATARQKAASRRNLIKARAARKAAGITRTPRSRGGRANIKVRGVPVHQLSKRSDRVLGATIPHKVNDRLTRNISAAKLLAAPHKMVWSGNPVDHPRPGQWKTVPPSKSEVRAATNQVRSMARDSRRGTAKSGTIPSTRRR